MQQPRQPRPSAYVLEGMKAQRAFWSGRVPASMDKEEMLELAAGRNRTPQQQAEVDEYNRDVHNWNTWVRATRQAKRVRAQAARNAAEVRTVRAQACPTCLASHPGEC